MGLPSLPRSVRWTFLALAAGVLTLVPLETWAASAPAPTPRLPSLSPKGSRHRSPFRHHRRRMRNCPTPRGGDNDQNGNGIDDRCDTGME